MLGAGGEQLAVYRGVQAAHEDSSGHMGRRVYMYNESYITAGGVLVTLPDGTRQFNAMDNIGSVRLTVSVKGQDIAAEHFDYKPFGDTLNAEGESRIGYAAQERDEESRYFAMGARQYDPLLGRFLSVDPLYESFPDKTPYHYCNNNPISFKDPSGLSPEGEKGKEDEVQVSFEGEEAQSNEILNMILQYDSDYRNSMKMQNTYDIDGEAMADASRQRMEDFGGGGQGFNNTGWDRIFGDDEGEEADRTGPEGEEVAESGCVVDEEGEIAKNGICGRRDVFTGIFWLDNLIGKVIEIMGDKNNPMVMKFHEQAEAGEEGKVPLNSDEHAWCASTVNYVIEKMLGGDGPQKAYRARNWKTFGVELEEPRVGCIAILRNPKTGAHHVGFYMGRSQIDGSYVILGGNQEVNGQADQLCYKAYSNTKYQWTFRACENWNLPKYDALWNIRVGQTIRRSFFK